MENVEWDSEQTRMSMGNVEWELRKCRMGILKVFVVQAWDHGRVGYFWVTSQRSLTLLGGLLLVGFRSKQSGHRDAHR